MRNDRPRTLAFFTSGPNPDPVTGPDRLGLAIVPRPASRWGFRRIHCLAEGGPEATLEDQRRHRPLRRVGRG